MPSPSTSSTGAAETRLPRRDWILLPLLGLLTVVATCAATESVAKHLYTESDSGSDQCHHFIDPYIGVPRNASCVYRRKLRETDSVEVRLNSRGYRNDTEATPKEPGTFRIVLMGSSFGIGASIPRDQSIAGMLPRLLSQHLGRKVELYNVSVPGFPGLPQNVNRRFADVLDAQPDLILWVLTRWDVKDSLNMIPEPENVVANAEADLNGQVAARIAQPRNLPGKIRARLASFKESFQLSRSSYLLQELFNKSQSQYLKRSLSASDDITGYLKASPSAAWQDRLNGFDVSVATISGKASAAHVPLTVALLPNGVQVALISLNEWPKGDDPYLLTNEVDQIVTRHGAVPLDVTTEFRTIPNPERDFFPVDGHPNAAGSAVFAEILAHDLEISGLIPRQSAAAQTVASQEFHQ